MTKLYANPVTINKSFDLIIRDAYPNKRFFIIEDNKKYPMSGTNVALAYIDQSYNCFLHFHVFMENPKSIIVLKLCNLQSIHFEKLLGFPVSINPNEWRIQCTIIFENNKFYALFPFGKLEAENITG